MMRRRISHSRKDNAFASTVVNDLNAAGAAAWLDSDEQGAADFQQRINKALAECEWCVVVLTPDAAASPWVRMEVHAASLLKRNGKIHDVIFIKAADIERDALPATWNPYSIFDTTSTTAAVMSSADGA
jgi:hypothetical protein